MRHFFHSFCDRTRARAATELETKTLTFRRWIDPPPAGRPPKVIRTFTHGRLLTLTLSYSSFEGLQLLVLFPKVFAHSGLTNRPLKSAKPRAIPGTPAGGSLQGGLFCGLFPQGERPWHPCEPNLVFFSHPGVRQQIDAFGPWHRPPTRGTLQQNAP